MRDSLRQAYRGLRRMPGTAVLAVATLAIGLAATATMFSAAYAALVRAVPFRDPGRLLVLSITRQTTRDGTISLRWSPAAIEGLEQRAQAFDAIGTFTRTTVGIKQDDIVEQVDGEIVSSGYFQVLDVPPVTGRPFSRSDEAPGQAVAILGERLWKRRFGGDPAIVGRRVTVNGVSMTVVGVMPEWFAGISGQAAVWIPIGMAPQLTYREYLTTSQHFINVIARLRPNVTLDQANAELAAIGPSLPNEASSSAQPARWSAAARLLDDARIDSGERRSLLVLLSAVGCVLLVTCVNIATLLLTRARTRRGEMAIRLALGASRGQLIRQLLAESLLLASVGAILGITLATWGIAWLRDWGPGIVAAPQNDYAQIATFAAPGIDAVVVAFVAVLTIVTTLAFGLAPALSASRSDPASALADSSRSVTARQLPRALSLLVICQIGIGVLLVGGALLLVATLRHLQEGRGTFDAREVVTFWINPPASRYADETGPAIVERLLDRIQQIPGITGASVNRCTPYGSTCARTLVFFPGRPAAATNAPVVGRHYVSRDYFSTLGIPLRRGRLLSPDDRQGRPPVTVINETAARRFWPGEDPIGKQVWFGSGTGFTDPARPATVVGVVGDVKYWPLNEPIGPDFYTSYLQFTYPSSMFIVKTTDAGAAVTAVRSAILGVDSTLPVYDVRHLDERVEDALSRQRFTAVITSGFAVVAAILAAMGVFGIMAYAVALRREELALRLALGASPNDLRGDVLRRAGLLALAGSAIGLSAAVVLFRLLRSVLYGVAPADPIALTAATAAMCLVALAAAAAPAWRASVTDPMLLLKRL
jgi:predicted permease